MLNISKNKITLTVAIIGFLSNANTVKAGFGARIVTDPQNLVKTTMSAVQSTANLTQLISLLKQSKETYEFAKRQATQLNSLGVLVNNFNKVFDNNKTKSNSYDEYVVKNKDYIKKGYSYNDYLSSSCIAQGTCDIKQARTELARRTDLLNTAVLANKDLIKNTPIYNKQIETSESNLNELVTQGTTNSEQTELRQLNNQLFAFIATQLTLSNKLALDIRKRKQAIDRIDDDEKAGTAAKSFKTRVDYKPAGDKIIWRF